MRAPGPGALGFLYGVRARGFLDHVGALWREHGDTFQVRLGNRTLLFAFHPDAVQQVTVSGRQRYDKVGSYDGVREFLTGQGLVSSTGELWRRQRKLLAPFFTPAGVEDYAGLMLRDAERLAERWDGLARDGGEVEIAQEMTQVTASIILRTMFDAASIASLDRIREALEAMISFTTFRMTRLPLPLWVPTPTNRRYLAARRLVHEVIAGLIAQRRATDPASWPDDLLSRLMTARDEETGEPMSEALLRDESLTAFVAGHETTARTMTFAWYALAAHPQVAERLHEELDRVLGGRMPTVADLRAMPYTLRVVQEVLRLYPPAPFYARDAVEDDELCGFDVPRGAAIMLSPYYTHRHPAFWEDPEVFDPDRWAPEREAGRHRHAYHPFAAGPRICIGNNFSLLETQLLLAVLATRFAPRLRDGFVPRWEMQGVLTLAGGLPMRIEARTA